MDPLELPAVLPLQQGEIAVAGWLWHHGLAVVFHRRIGDEFRCDFAEHVGHAQLEAVVLSGAVDRNHLEHRLLERVGDFLEGADLLLDGRGQILLHIFQRSEGRVVLAVIANSFPELRAEHPGGIGILHHRENHGAEAREGFIQGGGLLGRHRGAQLGEHFGGGASGFAAGVGHHGAARLAYLHHLAVDFLHHIEPFVGDAVVFQRKAEQVAGDARLVELLVEAANVGQVELQLAIGQRVLLGHPSVGVLLGGGDLPGGAGLGGRFDEGLVAVPVLILERFPPARKRSAALLGGVVLAHESLAPGFERGQVALQALVQHGLPPVLNPALDFKQARLHLWAGIGVVPEGFPEIRSALLQVGRRVEQHRDGIGIQLHRAVSVFHIRSRSTLMVDGLPPFRDADQFRFDVLYGNVLSVQRERSFQKLLHIHDVPAQVAEADVSLVHPAHHMADLVGQRHEGALLVLENVRADRNIPGGWIEKPQTAQIAHARVLPNK